MDECDWIVFRQNLTSEPEFINELVNERSEVKRALSSSPRVLDLNNTEYQQKLYAKPVHKKIIDSYTEIFNNSLAYFQYGSERDLRNGECHTELAKLKNNPDAKLRELERIRGQFNDKSFLDMVDVLIKYLSLIHIWRCRRRG